MQINSQQMCMSPSTCLKVATKCLICQSQKKNNWHIIFDMPIRMLGMLSMSFVFVLYIAKAKMCVLVFHVVCCWMLSFFKCNFPLFFFYLTSCIDLHNYVHSSSVIMARFGSFIFMYKILLKLCSSVSKIDHVFVKNIMKTVYILVVLFFFFFFLNLVHTWLC